MEEEARPSQENTPSKVRPDCQAMVQNLRLRTERVLLREDVKPACFIFEVVEGGLEFCAKSWLGLEGLMEDGAVADYIEVIF